MLKRNFALCILILPIAFPSLQAQIADTKVGTATVSGRVTLKGEPARGALVVLRSEEAVRSADRSPGLRIKTDENGRFWFASLKAGRYTLSAVAPGFITPVENTAINLSDGENAENQEIALKRGGVITGRVTGPNGKLLVEQLVELTRLDRRGRPIRRTSDFSQYSGWTDDRGVYRIYGLPAGRYLVSAGFAQREGFIMRTADRSYYQLTYHPDTMEESKAKAVEVSEGFEATDIDIKIAEAKKKYDVSGRVVDADTGQPLPGVRMLIGALTDGDKHFDSYRSADTQTNAKGEFQIQGVLPGKYATFGNAGQENDYYCEPAVFEISEDDVTGLVVKMTRGGSISGVAVIEGTNDPAVLSKLSQIQIRAYVKSEELSASGSSANISSDGAFTLKRLSAGVAVFSIFSGQEPESFFILRVEQSGVSQREGVQINSGEQITGVRIAIGYGTSVVRGQLRLTGGALPEGAILSVNAYRAGTEIVNGRGGRVDPGGRFVIDGLTPGEYELRPKIFFPFGSTPESAKLTERLGKQTQTVTVSGNQETQVTLIVDLTPREVR